MDRDLGGIRCRLDEESVVDVEERSAAARAAAASRPSLEKSRTGEKVVIDWVSWHVFYSVLLQSGKLQFIQICANGTLLLLLLLLFTTMTS